MNYYKFFGVSDDAKKMEIRRVANNMALANHPDKCPDRDDAKCIAQRKEKMIIINEVRAPTPKPSAAAEHSKLRARNHWMLDC